MQQNKVRLLSQVFYNNFIPIKNNVFHKGFDWLGECFQITIKAMNALFSENCVYIEGIP